MSEQKLPVAHSEILDLKSPLKTSHSSTTFDNLISPSSGKLSGLSPESLHAKPWPSRPQLLYNGIGGWRWWDSTIDFIMLLLPIPFFTLAAAVIAVNGKEVNDHDSAVLDQSIKGATTLFPICFAAIAGRASVKYATWSLEQGTTIGILEQLMGSRTVASAFTTQLQLRTFNVVGLGLLLLWSLSPIGGQSILHILFTPIKVTSTPTNLSYINLRQQSYSSPQPFGAFAYQWYHAFTILFGASLLSPTPIKTSPMDTWGNAKIPFFSSISGAGNQEDSDGWTKVSSSNNSTLLYSSLFGIPFDGIGFGNTTVTIESTYIELSCTNMTVDSLTLPDGTELNTTVVSTAGPYVSFSNATRLTPFAIGYKGLDITTYVGGDNSSFIQPEYCPDCLPLNLANMTFDAGELAFQEFDGSDPRNVTTIFCTPMQNYIESAVFCAKTANSQSCQVTAQRPSRLPHMPSEITYLSFPEVALGLTDLLPNATAITDETNEIQNYIYNPLDASFIITNDNSALLDDGSDPLQAVTLEDFQNRLGQLINTYIHGSLWNSTQYIIGTPFDTMNGNLIGGNNASFVPATTADLVAMIRNQTSAFTVPALIATEAQVYLCFFPWLGVFLFANSVMLLCAIVGVVYSRRTIVPEYLGFVSSLAKESPYIRMPDVGVNMNGMDKARMVKEVKVRLGDVSEPGGMGGDIGRLAFARLEETRKVQKGKLYV